MRINVEDSSLIPLSKDIYAFKHFNYLKSTIHEHDCIEIDFVIEGKAQLLFEKKKKYNYYLDMSALFPHWQDTMSKLKKIRLLLIFL